MKGPYWIQPLKYVGVGNYENFGTLVKCDTVVEAKAELRRQYNRTGVISDVLDSQNNHVLLFAAEEVATWGLG